MNDLVSPRIQHESMMMFSNTYMTEDKSPTLQSARVRALMKNDVKTTDDITKQYRLGKLLGKGGFGQVYMCTNQLTKAKCAIKFIKKSSIKHPDLIKLMEGEIEVLKNTNHPNIVRLIDMFEDEVNVYIVAELMKGGELYHYMEKKGLIRERQAASIVKQSL